jgi:hypothetical protein
MRTGMRVMIVGGRVRKQVVVVMMMMTGDPSLRVCGPACGCRFGAQAVSNSLNGLGKLLLDRRADTTGQISALLTALAQAATERVEVR